MLQIMFRFAKLISQCQFMCDTDVLVELYYMYPDVTEDRNNSELLQPLGGAAIKGNPLEF